MKSIREFAAELQVSPNTVRRIITQLQTELNQVIGNTLGRGKPTLLSDSEMQMIRNRLNSEPYQETSEAVVKAEIEVYQVPSSSIQVLSSDEKTELEMLEAEFIKPMKFSAIELNGTQSNLLDAVSTLAEIARGMKSQNDAAENDLNERKEKLEKTQAIATQIGQVIKTEIKRNDAVKTEAESINEAEQNLKKLLSQLQNGL